MRSSAAARRYAKALFALAREEERIEEVEAELQSLCRLLDQSAPLREVLLTPLHPAKQRKSVLGSLTQLLELSPTVRRFYAFLIDRRRLVDLDAIRDEYAQLAAEASGRTKAEVVSASPLDGGQKQRLQRALSRRTGREVELEVEVDPELIGGAVAKVGDLLFDGSLRTQLTQLRANLMKES
jgi:F-type H+-transporting ATPase subunit delta